MTLTLILIGGVAFAIVAAYVMTVRPYDVGSPALAGEVTAVGLSDSATDTLVGHNGHTPPTRIEWHLTTTSALCEAEDLLDCLENQGYAERELLVLGNSCFAVRWR